MTPAEEIKSRLDLVEVIREYIQLKAVGVNFQARCPFHREKTPSFIVSPEKQIWRCFGCGKGGDMFDFVMEIESLSFVEALRQLAQKAGVTLTRQNSQAVSQRNRLLDIIDLAARYYHKILLESPLAATALAYLKERGLTEKTISDFQIGYSLESWDDLNLKLKQKGFSDQEIFLAGLSVKKDGANRYYDRFRGRIMFPIVDYNSNTVAFSARVNPVQAEQKKADASIQAFRASKYINSPQTPIYDKSRIIYGLNRAKAAIREADAVVVVEGQMDVISSHQAGIENVVASSGTALSAEQVKLLKRYTSNILFSFDRDAAGELASERGIAQALSQDMNIRIVQVSDGKDPDECIRNNPADWQAAINQASTIKNYFFDKTLAGRDLSDVKTKKEIVAKLLTIITQIGSPIERDEWLQELSSRLNITESVLREVINRKKSNAKKSEPPQDAQAVSAPAIGHWDMLAQTLLAIVLRYPEHVEQVISQLMPEMLGDSFYHQFYKKLVIYYTKNSNSLIDYQQFRSWLHDHIEYEQDFSAMLKVVDMLTLLAEKDFYYLDSQEAGREIRKILKQIKLKFYTQRLNELKNQISRAEREHAQEQLGSLTEEFKNVLDNIKSLEI